MIDMVFDNVAKRFGDRRLLDDVSLSVIAGECQLLCGGNGAGKSTLLRILAGMERPNRCEISGLGKTMRWRRAKSDLLRDFIYLHQQPYLFEGSVSYNLGYPVRGSKQQRAEQVQRGLNWSGLSELADQPVHRLSGGERQRVALTRAWLCNPKVMLLDEPTSNMDAGCRQRTVELLNALKHEGVALVIATHDTHHFAGLSDRILKIENGKLNECVGEYVEFPEKVTPISTHTRVRA